MKRTGRKVLVWIMAMLLTAMALPAGSMAEETLEAWANDAGWIPFALALQQEGLEDSWQEGAKAFGELLGMPMDGPTLKQATLAGYTYEPQMDFMTIEGSKVTMKNKAGEVMFTHDYTWVETVDDVVETPVHVFRTEDADAGRYTYICLTAPETMETGAGSYLTFNLFATKNNYRSALNVNDGKGAEVPCPMIQADTTLDMLREEVLNRFAGPAVLVK